MDLLIPRILHFVWVGGRPLPQKYIKNMDRWKEHHPGWHVHLWTDVPPDVGWTWIVACEPRPIQIADILRVEMVHRHGGVYADLDSWAVQSIERMIDGLDSFAVRNRSGDMDNCIFGATSGHQWLQRVLTKVTRCYRPGSRAGVAGANLLIDARPESTPKFRLFDFGILNASPNGAGQANAAVYHAQDNTWKK